MDLATLADQRWRIVSWASLAMAGVVFVFLVIPQIGRAINRFQSWNAAAAHLEIIDSRLSTADKLDSEYEDLRLQLRKLSADETASGTPNFLPAIQRSASVAGVSLTEVRPGKIDTVEAARTTPVLLEVRGRFHDLGRFLSDLENGSLPLHMRAMQWQSMDDESAELNARFQMDAYSVLMSAESK